MPKKTTSSEESALFVIVFPKTKKTKVKERRTFYSKMKTVLEREKQALRIKDVSFDKESIAMEAEEFRGMIMFKKPIGIMLNVGKEIEKNKTRVNELGNKLTNYLNTIIGEYARDASVSTTLTISKKKGISLAKSFVEDATLAKINELVKKRLSPLGIVFEYASENRRNFVLHMYSESAGVVMGIISKYDCKGMLSWDFILEEYKNMEEAKDIVRKLSQKEF